MKFFADKICLVTGAASGIGVGGEARDFVPGEWDDEINVNLFGTIHGIQAVYPLMIRQGAGHIVNVASLGGEKLPCPVEDITTPVMVLHGEKDVISPQAYIEYIFNRLTCEKSLKIYRDCHHYIIFDHVPKVAPDVLAWIEKIC